MLELKHLTVTRVSGATLCHCALGLNTSYSLCISLPYRLCLGLWILVMPLTALLLGSINQSHRPGVAYTEHGWCCFTPYFYGLEDQLESEGFIYLTGHLQTFCSTSNFCHDLKLCKMLRSCTNQKQVQGGMLSCSLPSIRQCQAKGTLLHIRAFQPLLLFYPEVLS